MCRIVWHVFVSIIIFSRNILLKVDGGLLLPKGAIIKEAGCRVKVGELLFVIAVENTHVIRIIDSYR